MKTEKASYILIIVTTCGLMFQGCKKDKTPADLLPVTETLKIENADVQDAIADKNESEIDNTLDQIQFANYSNSSLKNSFFSGTRIVTIDHPDSTTFPKIITIVYNNFQDSTATERFVKNGEIDITVSAGDNKMLVTRAQVFRNFSVSTDSTTFTVKGTRSVERTSVSIRYNGLTSARVTASDHIIAYLNYAITKTGVSDTLKFTSAVTRIRDTYLHFNNVGGLTWQTIILKNVPAEDTITWYGNTTGLNEFTEVYTKQVSSSKPVTMIFYKGTPVLVSGTMIITTEAVTTSSYSIGFREDPDHLHMTLVTVRNNDTDQTRTFIRRLSRKFVKWWL